MNPVSAIEKDIIASDSSFALHKLRTSLDLYNKEIEVLQMADQINEIKKKSDRKDELLQQMYSLLEGLFCPLLPFSLMRCLRSFIQSNFWFL